MKRYRIPRDNDFYIGIPMKVDTGDRVESLNTGMMQGVEISLRNPYGSSLALEFRKHDDQQDTFVAKVYGDMQCGTYELEIRGWIQGRHIASRSTCSIEIVHELMRSNVKWGTIYTGEPYFEVEAQTVVFNGAILPQFSLNEEDMSVYVNDSLERNWEIDSEGYLVYKNNGQEVTEYQEPDWGVEKADDTEADIE